MTKVDPESFPYENEFRCYSVLGVTRCWVLFGVSVLGVIGCWVLFCFSVLGVIGCWVLFCFSVLGVIRCWLLCGVSVLGVIFGVINTHSRCWVLFGCY